MKNIILIILTSVVLFSCKKEKVTYTLSGQFVSCSSGTQYASKFDLFQPKNTLNTIGDVIGTIQTDINGNFSVTYETNSTKKLLIRGSTGFGTDILLEGIDVGNVSNLKIYSTFKYHLIVSLNVTKSYTSNDTLFLQSYTNAYPNGIKIAGPFLSGRVYVAPNLYSGTAYGGTLERYYCRLNNPNGTSGPFDKDYLVPLPTKCEGDSVYVTLDIK